MKILFSVLSLFLISFVATAQVKTGGIMIKPLPMPEILMKVDDKVRTLETHLRIKDKFCSGRNLSNKSDYVQTYFKLALVRSMNHASTDCSEVNAYFKCIADERTADMVSEIKKDPEYYRWMKTKYDLDEKQSKHILDFYSELGKKVK